MHGNEYWPVQDVDGEKRSIDGKLSGFGVHPYLSSCR